MEAITNMVIDKGKNLLNLEERINRVEIQFKRLTCRSSDIRQEVTKAEETGKKKRKREVENWFEEIQQVENDFNELKTRIQDGGFLRNLTTGDSVAKIGARIEELMEQSQQFDGFMLDDYENKGEPRLTNKLFGQMFQESLKRIWNWLLRDNLSNIGIYGQGGVGKTALAKHIHNHLLEESDFKISWVTVSQEFSIKGLQDKIANVVGCYLSEKDDEEIRANRLRTALNKMGKWLLILDDVWEEFFLEKIGIVLGPNNCRVILTTRSLQLCHRMHCQRKLKMATLNANEAWDLFNHTLGLETVLAAEVEEIAKLVARRCAGLPLAIITVAGSMRGVIDIHEWRNALEHLMTSSTGYKEMEDKVFSILEWSFIHLNGCEKLCFLYCCLYPEDEEIDREELINLFNLAELMPRRITRELETDHGHTILNKLIKACLLEEVENYNGDKCVKMHDLIRDMALRITSGKSISMITGSVPRFLVKWGESRLIFEQNEWTEDLNATSLFLCYDCIEIPPGMSPKCPNLSTLFFSFIEIERFPDAFFRHMDGLKVLNLRKCWKLKELPNCISDLVNLTALLLHGCLQLESIPPLRKLTQLRELDLSDTRIDDVPQGLEELVKLERLYMKETRMKNMIIPKGTFSKLYHLQHLVIPLSVQMSDPEVLKQLQVLRGQLAFIDVNNIFIKSRCWPQRYNIFIVGAPSSRWAKTLEFSEEENVLWFEGCNFHEGLDVVELPEDITELTFDKCFGLSDVFFQRLINRTKDLSRLQISCSEEVEFLLNMSSLLSNFAGPLQNLRCLNLFNLPNFVGLIKWGSSEEACYRRHQQLIPPTTFSSLTEIRISRCHKLKKLFTVKLLQESLQNLERLDVYDCEQLEEIAVSGLTTQLPLPKLSYLSLYRLPQLENICKETLICDSIEEIQVINCPKVKRLPLFVSLNATHGLPSPPKTLKRIYGNEAWWEALEWDNPNHKDSLQSFFNL